MQQQAGACSAPSTRANEGLAPGAATLLVSVRQSGAASQCSGSLPGGVVGPHPLRLGLLNRSAALQRQQTTSILQLGTASKPAPPQAPHVGAAQVTGAQVPLWQRAVRLDLARKVRTSGAAHMKVARTPSCRISSAGRGRQDCSHGAAAQRSAAALGQHT